MMSNRVDFEYPQQESSAVPAGRCIVFVDGVLCPHLSVKELVRASGPEYGRARLTYHPAARPGIEPVAPEQIETVAPVGRRVCIASVYDGGMGAATLEIVPLFAGRIEQIEKELGGDRQTVEIVARDFAACMARITLFGARLLDRDGRTIRLADRPLVFNPAGQPNASAASAQHGGRWYRMFQEDRGHAVSWTCAHVVQYLLCEHLVAGEIGLPCIEELEGLFAGRLLPALDLTGTNLLDGLEKCCSQSGVKLRFEPSADSPAGDQRIVFYRPGAGRTVELNHQAAGERFDLLRTNVCRVASTRGHGPATHRFIGWGGWKMYEATFGLVKAWDPSLEGGPHDLYSPLTNADFQTVCDVYRRWCLNEAGDYSYPPYSQGPPFDFSRIFERARYIRRGRCFEPALSSHDGESVGCLLEASYDDGATWQAYPESFDVLDDECGVWLSSDQLPAELWSAVAAATLKLRITATVQSDSRLIAIAANGPIDSTAEVMDHLIQASEFQYKKVSAASIFYCGTAGSGTGVVAGAGERDDGEALYAHVWRLCEAYESIIETIDVETPIIAQFCLPGDRLACAPEGRDVLGIRRDPRSIFIIDRAVIDYERQSTRLRISRARRRP